MAIKSRQRIVRFIHSLITNLWPMCTWASLKGNIHASLSHLLHNHVATQSDIMVPMRHSGGRSLTPASGYVVLSMSLVSDACIRTELLLCLKCMYYYVV